MRDSLGYRCANLRSRFRSFARRRAARKPLRSNRIAGFENLEIRQVLTGMPVITEVLASNDRVINDQDGDDSDFIEIFNAGDSDMTLNRYYLTDDPEDLRKWRFPDVPLAAGEYLVVFASNKDRKDPENELHTNFAISAAGEYLAIVEPDGQTIAFEYSPGIPRQVQDVSYGIPTGIRYSTLVSQNSPARVLVPTDGALDPTEPDVVTGTWLDPELTESAAWFDATTGIGYVPPDVPVELANSVSDFSGVQGQDGWYYGTWTKNFDSDGVYAINEFGELNAARFYLADKGVWDVGLDGAQPDTELTATGGHPSEGFFTHWAMRRWISETAGEITISGTIANEDATGDGIVGRILVNGNEIHQQLVNGNSIDYQVTTTVAIGDVIDFAIDPGTANDAKGDRATFTASISGLAIRELPVVLLTDSSDDWSRNGVQGENGWYYGLYDATLDPDRTYQPENFQVMADGTWVRTRWEWPDSSLPTQHRSTAQQGSANANTVHWAVRRWVSPVEGTLRIEYDFSKSLLAGDGTTGRLLHNGVELDMVQLAADDRVGVTRSVTISNVKRGDYIEFAVDPLGPGGDPQNVNGEEDRANIDIRISRVADLQQSIVTDIGDAMRGVGGTAYVRIPFNVARLGDLDELTLNVKYDDGFIAYINGRPVASANVPDAVSYNSLATEKRSAIDATLFEAFDITEHRGLFVEGQNVLQIQLLNSDPADSEALLVPELVVGTLTVELDQARYFSVPTPGQPNGLGADRVGPLVVESSHAPRIPTTTEAIVVTAAVNKTFDDVAQVLLTYRVMFGDSAVVTMLDDGQGSDAVAADGIYTAVIPAGLAKSGEMVRWYVTAQDSNGLTGRFPVFARPNTDEEYKGTIIQDTPIDSQLPVFHMFVERFSRATTAQGSAGAMFYNGEFYDNVFFDLHGQSSSGFPTQKKSLNVDFPNDNRLLLRDDLRRLENIDLLTNFADKSKMRNTLAYEQLAMTGGAYHLVFPIRLELNGEFYAVYDLVEGADERFLERLGYNPNNALYKIYNTFGTAAGAEKKTREFETNRDLSEFITGIRQSGAASVDYIMDNVNLAEMANFLAGFVLTSNTDCCHKNYYAYRDTEGTGEWWFFPWDNDLTQGRVWGGFGLAYFDDTMYPRNPLFMASNNELVSRLYSQVPGFRDMYLRRVRTLIDEYYKKPGTPADQLPFETRVAELYEMLKPDADLDNQNHRATWGQTGFQTFEQAVQIMLNEYIKPRREFLYFEQVVPDDTDVTVLLSGEPGATSGRYFVPTDESLGRNWTQPDFDDSSWREGPMGIGFEIGTNNYTDLITTDLGQELEGRTSLYARVPFDVADPSSVSALTLRMKYEDGFVAYLNGVEIAREGLREDQPTFDSTSRSRSSRLATEYQNINITSHLDKLVPGRNILAIQGLNASATSNDLFFLPEIVDGIISNSRGEVPRAQVGNPMIEFGGLDFNPTSGNQQQEYLTLVNNNDFSVDISHWQLTGDVEKTFDPGTVLIPGGTLYVTPDARAFRARSEGPTGGMRLFVQGNYDGYLPNVGGSVQLVARDGQAVSLLTYDGTTSPLQEHLRISELMYNPMEASATELAVDNSLVSDDFEFIELVNTSATETLSLSDVRLANGVQFDFTGAAVSQLEPGQRVLIVRNATAFALRYGNDVMDRVAGEFAANTALRDTGERVTLTTFDGSIIVDFEYSDLAHQGWPNRADGSGSSLVIVDPHGDYQSPQNWRASSEIHGSPGATEAAPIGGIVINELLTRPAAGGQDQIELYNPTSAAITLTNYFLSDSSASRATLAKFAIPATTIPAGGFLVLSESEFNAENAPNGFGLSGTNGEQLYLTVGDASGPTHFVDAVWFDGSVQGESFARIPDATGRLYPAVSQTFGSINSGPRVGPLVISELMINPGTPSAAALALNPALTEGDADLEYLEIHNPTASVVDLTEWRIRLGVDFDFDAGTQIGAGQTLLVLSFNPTNPANAARLAAFRAHYGLNENVQLIGNFAGQLSDQGEGVRLVRPGAAAPDDPTNIPRLLEDQVHYDDVTPWPVDAFTGGMSLTRLASNAFGDAATGWTAASPSPGTFGGELAGDLNGDGRLDADDVNRLQQAALTGDLTADLTGDGLLNEDDMVYLVENLMGTSIGDVNFDGVFNSRDLVLLFIAGQFEDGATRNSTYTSGDWNLDGEFTTDDLSFALRRGGYVPVAAAQARDAVFAEPPAAIAAAIEDEDDQQVDERWSGLEL